MRSYIRDYAALVRPQHWIKNCLVIAPAFFTGMLFTDLNNFLVGAAAFFSFSFIASVGYILNDLTDKEYDKQHPDKINKPIASNRIRQSTAIIVGIFLLALGMLIGLKIGLTYTLMLICYLAVSALYSLVLKNLIIIELFVISFGFLLRILAGGVSCDVTISNWLILLTFSLSLLLAFGKRRSELNAENGLNFRKTLAKYNILFLDNGVNIFATISIIVYSLYIINSNMDWMVFTIPFVCFGVLRYIYLVNLTSKGNPTNTLLNDIWILSCVVLWLFTTGVLIYFFDKKGFIEPI